MSLDTKYRPQNYDDVLGQKNTIKILRRFASTGTGFQQSYLFAGPFGSGKTTLARIFARSLLCSNLSDDGDPCNECSTCRSMLDTGSCREFVEVDAATNSGKEDITKITDEIQYMTFSGRHRIYLFDEAHRLSSSALDALLKPMEENVTGGRDKKLMCIFCTTEPEKMTGTILSRCAPAFVIHPVTPEEIAGRLAYICDKEKIKIENDTEILTLISESVECHIRDAIKAIEGVSLMGGRITKENAVKYLRLDLNTYYLDLLANIGTDFSVVVNSLDQILERISPAGCYEKLSDVAMMIYQAYLGVGKVHIYWDVQQVQEIGKKHGAWLLSLANKFASRPGRPTKSMLLCDLSSLHHGGMSFQEQVIFAPPVQVAQSCSVPIQSQPIQSQPIQSQPIQSQPIQSQPVQSQSVPIKEPEQIVNSVEKSSGQKDNDVGKVSKVPISQGCGVYCDPRAVGGRQVVKSSNSGFILNVEDFGKYLGLRLREWDSVSGQTRWNDMGSGGVGSIRSDKD